jgi:hypothetical protein
MKLLLPGFLHQAPKCNAFEAGSNADLTIYVIALPGWIGAHHERVKNDHSFFVSYREIHFARMRVFYRSIRFGTKPKGARCFW